MSTSELERRIGEVLRQHAEDAMNSTDTQTRFETLEHDVKRNRPRIKVGWVAAAAATAAVVAGLVVVDASRDDGSGTPAGPGGRRSCDGARVGLRGRRRGVRRRPRSVLPRARRTHRAPGRLCGRRVDGPGAMRPAFTERSARLWAKNVDRYVRAVERGHAS